MEGSDKEVGSNAEKGPSQKPAETAGKKENATLEQRIEILDWYQANGRNQTRTAKYFITRYPNLHIKQPLISAWVKDEKRWREVYEQSGGSQKSAKRVRQTQHPEVTEMMDLWVLKALGDGILLTGEVLRQKWSAFADMVCIPDDERLHLSNGWLTSFKERHNLKQIKCHGEAGSADEEVVKRERERIRDLIKEKNYTWNDIFNMDETGLFYGYVLLPFPVSSAKIISKQVTSRSRTCGQETFWRKGQKSPTHLCSYVERLWLGEARAVCNRKSP